MSLCFRGVWNVPLISSSYLVHHSVLRQLKNPYSSTTFESEMAFCASLRSKVNEPQQHFDALRFDKLLKKNNEQIYMQLFVITVLRNCFDSFHISIQGEKIDLH